MRKPSAKNYRLHTDSKGGLVLTAAFMRDRAVNLGDEFAVWKTSKGVMVVFKKSYRGKRKIPKHAQWGKVAPALPEILVAVPKPAKAAKVKKPQAEIQELTPEDVCQEYGVTRQELTRAVRQATQEMDADRKAGKMKEFTGTLPRSIARRKSRRKK